MITIRLIAFLPLVLMLSCNNKPSNERPLPIMGSKEVKNGDTIFHKIPEFQFVDQDSQKVTRKDLQGHIYVADFFFTTCPTICPDMKEQMARIHEEFKGHDKVKLISHTVDPKHDTVAVLKEYAREIGVNNDKWKFLTGDKEKIYEIGKNGYMATAREDEEAPGGFLHSGHFILVDQRGRVRGLYDGTKKKDVDKLMKDIQKLLKRGPTKQS